MARSIAADAAPWNLNMCWNVAGGVWSPCVSIARGHPITVIPEVGTEWIVMTTVVGEHASTISDRTSETLRWIHFPMRNATHQCIPVRIQRLARYMRALFLGSLYVRIRGVIIEIESLMFEITAICIYAGRILTEVATVLTGAYAITLAYVKMRTEI
jgi:hypothetical protein